MKLITRRCEIRNFREEDEKALCALLADPLVMEHLEAPYSEAQSRAFLHRAGLSPSPLIYAVWGRGNGQLLGYVIFHPYDADSWELGWVLFPRFWGIGIARELTRELISYAKARGIPSLTIRCVPENTATAAIARHFGFRDQGTADGLSLYLLKL